MRSSSGGAHRGGPGERRGIRGPAAYFFFFFFFFIFFFFGGCAWERARERAAPQVVRVGIARGDEGPRPCQRQTEA